MGMKINEFYCRGENGMNSIFQKTFCNLKQVFCENFIWIALHKTNRFFLDSTKNNSHYKLIKIPPANIVKGSRQEMGNEMTTK